MDPAFPVDRVRQALLDWYDVHARVLPWRRGPGQASRPDPYRVWLSEVMLQQTTTVHAAPYYAAFTTRWPTVADLAAAEDADVMAAWAGLGYYARARNMLKGARAVADDHGGVFPNTEDGLRALPGVGPYTAAAVAAIAFGQAANVVDGNVERVMARLFAVQTPLPTARPELRRLAARFVSDDRPGDWAQALMDLGATICRPRSPSCDRCPLAFACAGLASGDPSRFPFKVAKAERPRRRGVAWVIVDGEGRVALVRRPEKGLLGGMLGLPTSDWSDAPDQTPPVTARWSDAGTVDHVFTHFALTLSVRVGRAEGGDWVWMDQAAAIDALPTVFAKAIIASSRS